MINKIRIALNDAKQSIASFIADSENIEIIDKLAKQIKKTFENGNKVIISGNGGSAADAMHFAEEFTGKFRNERIPLPVMSIPDSTHITCTANDYGFEQIFSRQIAAFGKPGDLYIGLSTSGNSQNIIEAVKTAEELKMPVFLFLGKDGGKLNNMVNDKILIPFPQSDRIQEMHMMILHITIEIVERYMFPQNYQD